MGRDPYDLELGIVCCSVNFANPCATQHPERVELVRDAITVNRFTERIDTYRFAAVLLLDDSPLSLLKTLSVCEEYPATDNLIGLQPLSLKQRDLCYFVPESLAVFCIAGLKKLSRQPELDIVAVDSSQPGPE